MINQYTSVHDVIENQPDDNGLSSIIQHITSSIQNLELYVLEYSIDEISPSDLVMLQGSCDYLDRLLRKIRDLK